MLNATWLDTFTTLCDIGHFTRTAETLQMTQPGVSQHLRKLEAQVGTALIVQDGKTFIPTPAGEALLKIGKARRQQESSLREQLARDAPDEGEVKIGSSGSFATWLYPHLLERMKHAPMLAYHLTAAPQATIIQSVLSGDLDLGIIAGRPAHPQLDAKELGQEELCLALPRSLQAKEISLRELNALGFVAHPDGYEYADQLLGRNFTQEYRGSDHLNIRTSVNQIGQILTPVAEGLGYTILPKSGVDAFPRRDAVAVAELPNPQHHDLWLICKRGRARFARIAATIALIADECTALH